MAEPLHSRELDGCVVPVTGARPISVVVFNRGPAGTGIIWGFAGLGLLAGGAIAGIASQYYDPRVIGARSGALSSTTAIFWAWANWTGRLPEPADGAGSRDEVEVHGGTAA